MRIMFKLHIVTTTIIANIKILFRRTNIILSPILRRQAQSVQIFGQLKGNQIHIKMNAVEKQVLMEAIVKLWQLDLVTG